MENMAETPLIDKLGQRGMDFLGVRYPIISGGMTWISDSELVKAVHDCGEFGVLAAGNMPAEMLEEAQLKVEEYWMGALRRAVVDGDVDDGSLMAGQSVGLVDRIQPMREIFRELLAEAEAAAAAVRERLA